MKTSTQKISITVLAIILCINAHAITNALKVKVTNATNTDETVIRFLPNATVGFDASYDAYKIISTGALVPSAFTNIDSVSHLSVNALPQLTTQRDVELFVYAKTSGTFTIQSIELGAFTAGVRIVLVDKETGKFYNFRNGNSISITINANTVKTSNRFVIHFSPETSIETYNVTYNGLNNGYIVLTKDGNHNWSYSLKDSKGNVISSNTNINETVTITNLSAQKYTLYTTSHCTLADTNSIIITQPGLTTGINSASAMPGVLKVYQQDNTIALNMETSFPSSVAIYIHNSIGQQIYSYSNNQLSSLSENIVLSSSGHYIVNSVVNNIIHSQKITYIK